jgi:hypothetical protein
MSDWDRMLGEAALGRDLVPLDQVRGQSAQRSPGLMLIDQPRPRPTRLAATSPEAIFRLEALEFRTRGHDAPGRVVRLGSRWLRWTYRATLLLVLAAMASTWVIRTGESTAGPAVVDGSAGTVTALLPAVVAPDLANARGMTVTFPGGRSVKAESLRVQLADASAIRAAGLAPLSQPAILVTGQLTRSGPAPSSPAGPERPSRAEVTVVLRSESLAQVLARQFGAMLGQGTAP